MNNSIFKKENYKGHDICIVADDAPTDPRKLENNLGTLVCWHKKGKYGDEQPNENRCDYLANIICGCSGSVYGNDIDLILKMFEKFGGIILPVYMLDHSGITLKTTPFNDRWDSGLLGYIYVTKQKLTDENMSHFAKEQIESILKNEVELYSEYLNGEVYGYEIYKEGDDKEALDSSWGFYGMDIDKNGLLESAKEIIDSLSK